MSAQPCGAALPEQPHRDKGWDCTGKGLAVLFPGPGGLPCVLAEELVDDYLKATPYGHEYEVRPFAGGDHCHAIRRPWPFGFGRCPYCDGMVELARAGWLVAHWQHRGGDEMCPAAGTPPARALWDAAHAR